jgi:hypothetical protein
MFKIKNVNKNTYAEIAQANPLRWRIMHRNKDTLTSQSGLIKCKDFFNDVVAWKQGGHKFNIYRFNNAIKFNRYGVYFLLSEIANREQFFANLDVLNQKLQENLNTKISYYKARSTTQAIIHIPNPLWRNTYFISTVSMMIRLCNYNYSYKTWDDFFNEDAPLNTVETAFTKEAKKLVKETGFVVPEKAQNCWYFAPYGWNSKSDHEISATIIHNNGASNWAQALSN